uniref:apoptosis regulator Bcl-2-like n=1 Tax=Scatophagus argus TaxID=75038 RepID=UPI001ED7E77B|nr:apoptosis regulator Bcl-2-like [Scatophagus argus]
MAAAYNNRDIVDDYLRYKLLNSGLQAWSDPSGRCRTGAQRRRYAAASASTSSQRAERAVTSYREVTQEDTQQGPRLAPPRLQVVLRCAGDELQRRYHGDLAAHVSVLLLGSGSREELHRGLTAVREELFRDGVNWGRIVAMMELGGALCTKVVQRGGAWQVDNIAGWMEESLDSSLVQGWIEENGGWDAFTELYGESRPPASLWSLRTAFALAALGAAGIILGVLFTHR